jgi:hypothetical protein
MLRLSRRSSAHVLSEPACHLSLSPITANLGKATCKMIWRDLVAPMLEETKQKSGVGDRIDIATIANLIEFEEGRKGEHRWVTNMERPLPC